MRHSRSGFALLLVLAATLVVTAGATLAITLLLDTRRRVTLTTSDDHLLDTLAAGEQLAMAWIAQHSRQLTLPAEGGSFTVVHDQWRCQQGDGALVVRLYDGCALIPARCLGPDGSLRSALPTGWASVPMPTVPEGRDEQPDWLESVALPAELLRFPRGPAPERAATWSTQGTIAIPVQDDGERAEHLGLAAIAGPHTQGAINVNTAPEPLLRAAFTQAGLGGLDEVLRRRRRGLFTPSAPEVPPALRFRFVSETTTWCALISARWDGSRRSWWVVVTGNPTELRIVQRHDAER